MTATRASSRKRRSKSKSSGSTRSGRQPARSSRERFEARRLAAKRQAGLKRLRLVFGLTAVSTLAIALIAFINSSWFDVDEIEVVGHDRADPHLIVEASGIEVGQGLLDVDLEAAVGRVELVPWIGTASVDRDWDGTIEISVVERGPSVALRTGSRFALVDDHGRQLDVVDARPDGFLPVSGIEASGVAGEPAPPAALPVIALLDALPTGVETQVSGVAVEGDELFLRLTAGGRANFGDGTDLGPKLQALETMLARVDLRCLETIDVSVPAAPVLTRTRDLNAESGVDGQNLDAAGAGSEDGEEPDSTGSDC